MFRSQAIPACQAKQLDAAPAKQAAERLVLKRRALPAAWLSDLGLRPADSIQPKYSMSRPRSSTSNHMRSSSSVTRSSAAASPPMARTTSLAAFASST